MPAPPLSTTPTTVTCPPHASATVVNNADDRDASKTSVQGIRHRQLFPHYHHLPSQFERHPSSTSLASHHLCGSQSISLFKLVSPSSSRPSPTSRNGNARAVRMFEAAVFTGKIHPLAKNKDGASSQFGKLHQVRNHHFLSPIPY